jgi:hypothetical protein
MATMYVNCETLNSYNAVFSFIQIDLKCILVFYKACDFVKRLLGAFDVIEDGCLKVGKVMLYFLLKVGITL